MPSFTRAGAPDGAQRHRPECHRAGVAPRGVILILSLLYAVYEAYSNGGDVRALGVAGVKYLVLGLVFLNYQQAFRSVNGMFKRCADFNLQHQWHWRRSPELAEFRECLRRAARSVQLLDARDRGHVRTLGYALDPRGTDYFCRSATTLFTLAYAMYGSILYIIGPFVLALWPSRATGTAVTDLLCKFDDLSKLGPALRDSPSAHDCAADEQRERLCWEGMAFLTRSLALAKWFS